MTMAPLKFSRQIGEMIVKYREKKTAFMEECLWQKKEKRQCLNGEKRF
jgi:hypothetical protein